MLHSAKIDPIKGKKDFYLLTLIREEIGQQTKIEVVCSSDTLRWIKNECRKALGEKPDYSDLPDNLRKFMEDENE
jgi:hypothetical protein